MPEEQVGEVGKAMSRERDVFFGKGDDAGKRHPLFPIEDDERSEEACPIRPVQTVRRKESSEAAGQSVVPEAKSTAALTALPMT